MATLTTSPKRNRWRPKSSLEILLADKGYDADSFINSLEIRTIKAVIPPRSTRKVKRPCDFALYAERNLVERFFNTIKCPSSEILRQNAA